MGGPKDRPQQGTQGDTHVAGSRAMQLAIGAGVVLVALNLRAGITSVGAVLDRLSADLNFSGTQAGLLTMLPVAAFAAIGFASPLLVRRLGLIRGLTVACLALVVGLAARATATSGLLFLVWTALAMTGIAVANVSLPAVVKANFPHRLGLMTGLYTMAMQVGSATAAGATAPIADASDSWRVGLGVWAVMAVLGLPPWIIALLGQRRERIATQQPQRGGSLARNSLAWAMAVFFGIQSLAAYVVMGWVPEIFRDAGVSSVRAGLLLAVIMALAAPIALLLPTLANRLRDQRPLVIVVTAAMAAGWVGLMVAPAGGAWVWAVLLGIGSGAFPLALTMIGLRARGPEATASLSAFAQSTGYVIAISGPFAMGALHDLTDGWTVPLALLLALMVPQLVSGLAAGRNRVIDPETAAKG